MAYDTAAVAAAALDLLLLLLPPGWAAGRPAWRRAWAQGTGGEHERAGRVKETRIRGLLCLGDGIAIVIVPEH
eukprot:COSAG01_NODE_2775_length_7095_cov_4.918811_2_plen_73_part_00